MKIVILGYGSIGKRHEKILRNLYPNSQFQIIDPFLGHNSDIKGTYDLGLVCTNTSEHITSAKKLLGRCGLIFIEKPLHTESTLIKENQPLFENDIVHIGCNIRYTDAIEKFRNVKNPKLIRVTSMSNLLSWRQDQNKKAYSFHKSLGGGVLMDFIHEPDYIYSVYGLPDTSTLLQKRLHENVTVDSDDSCMLLWSYKDKFVSFCLSYGSKDYIRKIEILKESGESLCIDITKDDIELSYKKQWEDILRSGPKNSYSDCLKLYEKLLGEN